MSSPRGRPARPSCQGQPWVRGGRVLESSCSRCLEWYSSWSIWLWWSWGNPVYRLSVWICLSVTNYQGLYNVNVTRLCVEMEVGKTSRYAKWNSIRYVDAQSAKMSRMPSYSYCIMNRVARITMCPKCCLTTCEWISIPSSIRNAPSRFLRGPDAQSLPLSQRHCEPPDTEPLDWKFRLCSPFQMESGAWISGQR